MVEIDFKEVIEGSYGIKDLPTYNEYKKAKGPAGITKEEIDRLSPDNIDSSSFWGYIERNPELAKDAITFGATKDTPLEQMHKQNFGVACNYGVFNYVLLFANHVGMPMLDIGAGYGMLKEYIERNTKLKYHGIDVYPKIEGVLKCDGKTFPPELSNTKFGLIISTNVFQHLSVAQRRSYYEQVANSLMTGGVFTVTNVHLDPTARSRGFLCKETGKEYMCHYGQYTEIQSLEEIRTDLLKHFHIISMLMVDNWGVSFHCTVLPKPPPSSNVPS